MGKLSIVTHVPVSMLCHIHILADGPYGRAEMQRLIANLQLQMESSAFDVNPLEQGVGEQSLEQAVARGKALLSAGSGPARGHNQEIEQLQHLVQDLHLAWRNDDARATKDLFRQWEESHG